jgi:exonuclease VII small subunit
MKNVLLVGLLVFLPSAYAQSQAKLARECDAEIDKVERRIADARKKPEYKSERGRQALSSADRSLNQARVHAAKGESRHCLDATQKSRSQISGR